MLPELPFKHHQTFRNCFLSFLCLPPCSSMLHMMRWDRLLFNRWFSDFQARYLVWLMLYSACLSPRCSLSLSLSSPRISVIYAYELICKISFSLSLNGLIKTSVHKVLTTFCCSLNISVNPVFSFEFGWLSLHVLLWFLNAAHLVIDEVHGLYESVLIFSKCFFFFYEHMLKLVFLHFGFSVSETTGGSEWQICSCLGDFCGSYRDWT